MNKYQKIAQEFKEIIDNDVNDIYEEINWALKLEINNINLLKFNSAVNSSTALGFIIEEYIVQKLIEKKPSFYSRNLNSTNNSSYDLLCNHNEYKIVVNLKINNNKSSNNAICALTKLINDYCQNDKEQEKLFLIFKTYYSIENETISIKRVVSYYLGQIYMKNLKIDNRSWSKISNGLNGRIQYNYKKNGLKKLKEISYKNTVQKIMEFEQSILEKNNKN